MRIYGKWRADYDAAFVSALLSSKSLGILEHEVDFLIDTGAVKTTILDRDAKLMGIRYDKLQRYRYRMTGIGGSVNTYVIKDSTLTFSTDIGTSHEEGPEIVVLRHAKMDEGLERLPSLLGRDVLDKYHLIYSKPLKKVYLTDEAIST